MLNAPAVLLVLHAERVHSGVQPHRPDQRMHVGRRCPPNHQFTIQPHVEAVVARAVQFDVARFARVPVAGPARAEESPGQVGIVVQEVEGDRGADVVEERCAIEADIGKDLPADAGPVRRAGAEDKQERGEPAATPMDPKAKARSRCRLSRSRRSPTGTDLWTAFAERRPPAGS